MANDPEVEANFAEIARLKKVVSPLFQKGWAKAHPMPEKHRAMIEKAFSQKEKEKSSANTSAAEIEKSEAKIKARQKAEDEANMRNEKRRGPTQSM
jgi:hypothetical protein